jgi:ribosomal protein S1
MTLDRRLTHARQAATVVQSVDVTVLAIDEAERRVSLSMVEQVRQERDAEAAEDRREQDRVLGEQKKSGSLGTFADLLDAARRK